MGERRRSVPRRSATVYAAVARLSARPSTGFYLHCALPAIRALRAPLRQETSRMAVNCATAPTAYTVADLLYHTRRLYKIYSGLVKRMLAMLLCPQKYKKMYLLSFNMLQKVHPLFVFLYNFLVFYSLWEMKHYFRAGSQGAFDLHRVLLSII